VSFERNIRLLTNSRRSQSEKEFRAGASFTSGVMILFRGVRERGASRGEKHGGLLLIFFLEQDVLSKSLTGRFTFTSVSPSHPALRYLQLTSPARIRRALPIG
jgi:hypothetical protein